MPWMSRPKRRWERYRAELDRVRSDIRAVILTGAGEKAFAAGADVKAFLELNPPMAKRRLMRSHAIYSLVENFEWPVIAALHGFCLGGGLELALCCDVRYASENTKLGFLEVNLSVFPGNGGSFRGRYFLPLGRLKELVFTGETISASEALSYGLIEKLCRTVRSWMRLWIWLDALANEDR